MKFRLSAAVAAGVMAMAGAAGADVLYENPGSDFSYNHTPIGYDPSNYNFAGDSFTLGAAATVTGVRFTSWTAHDDLIKDVSWAILDGKAGAGNILAKGSANVSATFYMVNFYAVDVANNTFAIPGLNLGSGTYWLYLSEAGTYDGGFASWDNTVDGTSLFHNGSGRTTGNTFSILGQPMVRGPGGDGGDGGGDPCHTNLPLACGGGPGSAVPEPAAWALMICGFGLVGATLRQRRRATGLAHS